MAAYAYVIKMDQEKMRPKNTTGTGARGTLAGGGCLGGVQAEYSITSFVLTPAHYRGIAFITPMILLLMDLVIAPL